MSPSPPAKPGAAGPNTVVPPQPARRAGAGARSASTAPSAPMPWPARPSPRPRPAGARAFWVVMHYAGVSIAARLARAERLPLHLTVHDDPAFGVALRSKRYLALVPWIERDFAFAMRRASSVDVIGRGMAERYRRRYGVESTIVHRALDDADRPGRRLRRGAERPPRRRAREHVWISVSSRSWPVPSRPRRVGWASRRDCSSSARGTASSSGPSSTGGSRSSRRGTSPSPRPSRSCATASRST